MLATTFSSLSSGSPLCLPPSRRQDKPASWGSEQTDIKLFFFTSTPVYTPSPASSLLLSSYAFSSRRSKGLDKRALSRSPLGRPPRSEFDIVSHLPQELVVKIFRLLEPRDLTSVCVVCRKWNQLVCVKPFSMLRSQFVSSQREAYQQCKENRHLLDLPRYSPRPHLHPMTPISLNTIQPPSRASANDSHTPSLLLQGVRRLQLTDNEDIRRCLFTDSTDGLDILSEVDCSTSTVGKKANKNRLKRL